MKKLFEVLFIFMFAFLFLMPLNVEASEKEANVYIFHGKTCHNCEEALKYLNNIKDNYNLKIYEYEVWYNEENYKTMDNISSFLDFNVMGVPFTIINNTPISGYSKGVTDDIYKYHINQTLKPSFIDKVGIELGVVPKEKPINEVMVSTKEPANYLLHFPFNYQVDLSDLSVPISSLLIGIIDGFNSCIIWILFILSIIISNLRLKKIWFLGIGFLIINSLIYLLLNIELSNMIKLSILSRLIISVITVICGCLGLKVYSNSLTSDKNINENSKLSGQKSFAIIIVITILLSIFSAFFMVTLTDNLLLVYKNEITINSSLYILFFICCRLLIFFIIIKIVKSVTNLVKQPYLIKSILLLILGILFILKPEWIMMAF